jgi:hypothetical protein
MSSRGNNLLACRSSGLGSRSRHRLSTVGLAILPLVLLIDCNGTIVFKDSRDGSSGDTRDLRFDTGSAPDIGTDLRLPDADLEVVVHDDGAGDASSEISIDAAPDRPLDAGSEHLADAPIEVATDASRDAPPDAPREASVDTSGPFVCGQDTDCRLPGLHCLLNTAGQPGRCVECTGNNHCPSPGGAPAGKLCDPVLHRCVECTVAADCPSPSSIYPSQCGATSHICIQGCQDDTTTACPTVRSYHCNDDIWFCVECLSNADCVGSSHGALCNMSDFVCVQCLGTTCSAALSCDPVTARCVECKSTSECLTPARPLCDPTTLTCVAVPP